MSQKKSYYPLLPRSAEGFTVEVGKNQSSYLVTVEPRTITDRYLEGSVRHRLHAGRGRRPEFAPSAGFTLIELLIVMVVLGILAAVVIVALVGVQASSAASACNSDAKTVEIAVESFRANPENTAAPGQYPATGAAGQTQLTDPAADHYGGPYLRTWPSNITHYTITLDPAVRGRVDVTPAGSATPLDYDSTTNPCSGVS